MTPVIWSSCVLIVTRRSLPLLRGKTRNDPAHPRFVHAEVGNSIRLRPAPPATTLPEESSIRRGPILADGAFFVYAGFMELTKRLRAYTAYPDDVGRASLPAELVQQAVDEIERLRDALNPPHGKPEKLRIYLNRNLRDKATPNKLAAHAVHAALQAFGVHPGVKVIVLDAGPTKIEQMRVSIRDAGHTELEPGTLTAGTNWPADSES